MDKNKLTQKMENFALAYVRCGVGSQAYRETYGTSKMKDETIRRRAWDLLQVPKVKARIAGLNQKTEKDVIFGVAEAMRDALDLHMANANDLVQVRRLNCRHCYGTDHLYQWRTRREFADAQALWLESQAFEAKRRGPKRPMPPKPTDDGGYGFQKVRDPHPDCPKCDGEGLEDVKVMDSRKLTGRAKKLYAGVKQLKDGRIEVLTRNQDLHLTNLMKALGMFTENVKILPPGAAPDGVPAVPEDPAEASRVYQAFLKGEK